MKTLIITDNPFMLDTIKGLQNHYKGIDIRQSPNGNLNFIDRIDVKRDEGEILENYTLVVSIHCKQFFPSSLVKSVRCVNVHPGFNPYNRGWFPQIFSIINGLPAGVTIHEMDEMLDHGPIIAQEECEIEPWDTSESLYLRILEIEKKMLWKYYKIIKNNDYVALSPSSDGNLNSIRDFENIKKIKLNQVGTFEEFLNLLRALSHGQHKNAYFFDKNGKKVFVRILLEREKP